MGKTTPGARGGLRIAQGPLIHLDAVPAEKLCKCCRPGAEKRPMERLAQGALAILAVAANGLTAGHALEFHDPALPRGAIRILSESDWPLHSLRREYGASEAYRIHAGGAAVRVEGQDLLHGSVSA